MDGEAHPDSKALDGTRVGAWLPGVGWLLTNVTPDTFDSSGQLRYLVHTSTCSK